MRFSGEPIEAVFLRRVNRFLAQVKTKTGGKEVYAHVPNSGRLGELLYPGNRVMLRKRPDDAETGRSHRRTSHTVVLAQAARGWACVVSAYANVVVREAGVAGLLPGTEGYAWQAEVPWGGSRLDYLLTPSSQIPPGGQVSPLLLEVKGVTLLAGEQALFPDAPTGRGVRHLQELARAAAAGYRAAVVFAVMLEGGEAVAPHQERDPAFFRALDEAAAGGVALWAFGCRVTRDEIVPERVLPVVGVPSWRGQG